MFCLESDSVSMLKNPKLNCAAGDPGYSVVSGRLCNIDTPVANEKFLFLALFTSAGKVSLERDVVSRNLLETFPITSHNTDSLVKLLHKHSVCSEEEHPKANLHSTQQDFYSQWDVSL